MDTATMAEYYAKGLWHRERLDRLLAAGKITPEQYAQVVNGGRYEG